jgi:hydrogenase maturation protein HypF
MTSCNPSELPIIKDDAAMFAFAESHADELGGVLYHTRKIVTAMDDSVARVVDGKPQLIRRAKGYAPLPIYLKNTGGDDSFCVFAAGADLKSSFALSKGSFIYPSRFIGDLGSVEQMEEYKAELARMEEFFSVEPNLIVCDMHPGYESVRFAEELFPKILRVQHHHAHIASVMAEHRLTSVIGVSFDGTGYGTDGCIWGGEILLVDAAGFERFSHLKYVDMIGGDSSMKDGWKSALSHMLQDEIAGRARNDANEKRRDSRLRGNDKLCDDDKPRGNDSQTIAVIPAQAGISDTHERIFKVDISKLINYSEKHDTLAVYGDLSDTSTPLGQAAAAIRASVNTVRSSSMGRLFDAASSLLGLAHVNRYEGECAICLEAAARRAMLNPGADEADDLALAFHEQISENILATVLAAREETGRNEVCISGGVFQNKILTEKVLALLRTNGFDVYYNESVPCGDGGIALGQVYVAMMGEV